MRRKRDLGNNVVAAADRQRALMLQRAEQDRAVAAGIGPRLVARQPDGVGPVRSGGGAAAAVGDRVADLDAGAFDRLRRCHNAAGDQVGKRVGFDEERHGGDVVGIVRILVDRAAAVGLDDQENVAAEADRDLNAAAVGGVLLAGIERCAVVIGADQQVVAGQPVVQRQVDAVLPARRGRRDAALVDDREAQRYRRTGRGARRRDDVGHLQIGTRQQGDLQRLVVGGAVVGGGAAVLVHLPAGVGQHDQLIDALGARRQTEALGTRVGDAGLEATCVVGESTEEDPRIVGLPDLAHRDDVGPGAFGLGQAVVGDRPAHVDGVALGRRRRRDDVGHLQIRRVGQDDIERPGDTAVVARVDELEGAGSAHAHVMVARESVGDGHFLRAAVAVAGCEHAEVRESAEHGDQLRAGRIGSENQLVVPARDVGRTDADVADLPRNVDGAPRTGGGGHARLADHQIGVGHAHHVEDARRLGGIVGLEAVLEDLVAGVAAHEEVVAPLEVRGQQEGLATRVAVAGRQRADVVVAGDDAVVAVADDGIGRYQQGVGPLRRLADAVAVVADRPADGDLCRIADDHLGRRRIGDAGFGAHGADDQVGIGRQRSGEWRRADVVVLGTDLAHLPERVADHQHEVVAAGRQRQIHLQLRVVAGADGERSGMGKFTEQRVVAAERRVARQVDAIGPGVERVAAAGIAHLPRDDDGLAGKRAGRRGDRHRQQIGMYHAQGRRRDGAVVALLAAFENGVGDVAADDDQVIAVDDIRQDDFGARRVAGQGRQFAAVRHGRQQLRPAETAVGAEVDAVAPAAARSAAAAVGDRPRNASRLAGSALRRHDDLADTKIGEHWRQHLHRRKAGGDVVVLEHAFEDLALGIGVDQDAEVSGHAEGQEDVALAAVAFADAKSAAVQQLRQQRVAGIERGVGRQVDAVLPLRHVGRPVAGIAHPPADRRRFAAARAGRRGDDLDLQVGVRRR